MNLTRIIDSKPSHTYPQEWIENNLENFINGDFVKNWQLAPEYSENYINPIWNGSEWIEGATPEEIAEANKPIVPQTISAMRLRLQLFDMGITDEDIFEDIDSTPEVMFSTADKEKAKIMYKTATSFERTDGKLNLVATMEGLTQEQLDNIFINGNQL